MISILYKEFLEFRLFFLLMILTGFGSMLILSWCRVLDNSTGVYLLFLLEAPLLIYVMAYHSIFSEFHAGTLPFLLGLPLGRSRVWLAKVAFVLLFAFALYLAFLLVGAGFGLSVGPIGNFDLDRYVLRNVITLLGIPILVVAIGMFTTMLFPEGFAHLAIILLVTAVIVFFRIFGMVAMFGVNFFLLEGLLIAGLLFTSWYTFLTGNLFSPFRLALRAVLVLAASVAVGTAFWTAVDHLAEAGVRQLVPDRLYGHITDDGRYLYANFPAQAAVWDTVSADIYHRSMELDLSTGRLRPIGRRTASVEFPTSDGKGLYGFDPWVWPGVAARDDLLYFDLTDSGREYKVDSMSRPDFLQPDGSVVYSRFNSQQDRKITEICRWHRGEGGKVLAAVSSKAFRRPKPVRLFNAMLLTSRVDGEASRLLSLQDGALLPVSLPHGAVLEAESPMFALFGCFKFGDSGRQAPGEFTWLALDASGTRRDFVGLPETAEIRGTFPDGRLLVQLESKERSETNAGIARTTTLSIFRMDDGASRTLAIFHDEDVIPHLAPDGGYVICMVNWKETSFCSIDLSGLIEGESRLLPEIPVKIPGNPFRNVICRPNYQALFYGVVNGVGELWETDLRQGANKRRFGLAF